MGGAHILVVDDDGYFRTSVLHALQGLGHRLSCVESVPGALGFLRSQSVDVIVADHVMPGLSGLAAIEQAAVFRFIEKPLDPAVIRHAILSAGEKRSGSGSDCQVAGVHRSGIQKPARAEASP